LTGAVDRLRRLVCVKTPQHPVISAVAASWTPDRACTADRVEATRDTDCSCASRSALATESFTMKTLGEKFRSHRGC
jgi:hypothetical protein